jgi:hypothetical protein
MARVFLSNETYNAATSGAQVFGAAGTEQVNVFSGTTGVSVASSVERVDLSGNIADFTFSSFGAAMTVRDSAGNIVATVSDSGGKSVVFADGALSAVYAGTTLSLGGVALTGTAAAITPAAADIDATTTSDAPASTGGTTGGAGQTFMLTTGTDISGVLLGSNGTINTDGDDTLAATNLTYTAGDVLVGGNGNDVLNIEAGANNVTAATSVSGIETVNVNFTSFATQSFDANNVVGAAITVNQGQTAGATSATVNNLSASSSLTLDSDFTGTLTMAGAAGTVNAVDAATVTATLASAGGSITINGDDSTNAINLSSAAGAQTTDSATINGAGTVALDAEATGTAVVENLTLSGNGAAVIYDIADAATAGDTLETLTFTGDQSVTVIASAAAFAGLDAAADFADNTTAGTVTARVDTRATADLTDVKADVMQFGVDGAAATLTVANAQNLALTADVNATASLTVDSTELTTGDETLNLEVQATQTTNALVVSDFEVVNLNVDDQLATTGTVTLAGLTGGASTDVNVTGGPDNLTLTAVTADNIVATNYTGNLNVATNANVDNVTGGSGNDIFVANNAAGGAAITFTGNGGNDTLQVAAATTTGAITFTGGAGTVDTLQFTSASSVADRFTTTDVETFQIDVDSVIDARDITGQSFIVTGDNADGAETLTLDLTNTNTVDLSSLVVDTTANGVVIATANPVALATTFTGSNGVDTVTLGAGDDVLNGGAGADVLDGAGGADSITGGEGADQITGGLGADSIILTETTAAKDTVVVTSGLTVDTVTGYTAGSAATSDELDLDYSELVTAGAVIAAKTLDFVEIFDNNSLTNASTTALQTLTGAATAVDAANLFLLDLGTTKFANAAAAVDALEAGGAAALTFAGNIAANDAFVFAYENTSGGVTVAVANFVAADDNSGGAAATGAGNLEGADLVTLTGVSDVSTLVAADFDWIA